jgi:paraquat-inducible protein B
MQTSESAVDNEAKTIECLKTMKFNFKRDMTMKRVMTILTALTVVAICSCSRATQDYSVISPDLAEDIALQANEHLPDKVETEDRKIIKQGEIRFETADVNKTKSLILQTLQELNGYISQENAYNYYERFEHRLVIRVSADKFDILLKNISESVDKLDSKNINVLDVTEEYIDIEARVKTKKELQTKYIELLKQATKIDEILNIEREIGNLQTEIESVEGRMKYLKDKIAFSTLTVVYYQKTTSKFGFSSKFIEAFKNGWSVFLWFIIGLSHLWVFILVSAVTIYFIRRWKKGRINVSQK